MSDFLIYINDDTNPASLIIGKVNRTLPDAAAEAHNMVRVIDEDKSEPDGYLYPAVIFAPIEVRKWQSEYCWQQAAMRKRCLLTKSKECQCRKNPPI
jgi:hypothetical protein